MTESAERRPLISLFRVVDDTLEEIGLPGPFDILPTPSEVLHAIGLSTPDDFAEGLKARVASQVSTRIRRF